MEEDFWHRRWKKNEIGFHQDQVNLHLRELWPTFGISSTAPVFVPLCGKSKDMLWLAQRGHPILGIELSEIAVKDFFTEAGLTPAIDDCPPFTRYQSDRLTLLHGDFFALSASHTANYPVVYDRASLVAFPPEMRRRYARHLTSLLSPGATVMLITFEYPEAEMKGPPFNVSETEVSDLFGADMRVEKLRELDVLAENPRFVRRGLSSLQEKVFRLTAAPGR